MNQVDERLGEAYRLLNIPEDKQKLLGCFTGIIKAKDEATYYHCVRCGLYGAAAAERMLIDPKALFYSGLLHDVGKIMVDPEILKITEGFGKEEFQKIKAHSLAGYHILKGVFEFAAEVIVRHHVYAAREESAYPKKTPKSRKPWSKSTQALINYYARLLSIIDFYDIIDVSSSGLTSCLERCTIRRGGGRATWCRTHHERTRR